MFNINVGADISAPIIFRKGKMMNMTSGIKDMMHQHEIIDIGGDLHVIDGKVFYYKK